MSEFEIHIDGWKAWTALSSLVVVGVVVGVVGVNLLRELPYEAAEFVVIDDGRSCVYANQETDRAGRTANVFRAYPAQQFEGRCPHHPESPVAGGDARLPSALPE